MCLVQTVLMVMAGGGGVFWERAAPTKRYIEWVPEGKEETKGGGSEGSTCVLAKRGKPAKSGAKRSSTATLLLFF